MSRLLNVPLILSLAAACALPVVRVREPLGPDPLPDTVSEARVTEEGTLVVLTELVPDHTCRDSSLERVRRSYVITNRERTFQREVTNHGVCDSEPQQIRLPVGTYLIRGISLGFKQVEATVIIAANRRTTVDWTGEWHPAPPASESAIVRTDDGVPVGWRNGAR